MDSEILESIDTVPERVERRVYLKQAQALNVRYWQQQVDKAEADLKSAMTARAACLSAIVAGENDGVWNVEVIDVDSLEPHLVISRAG